MEKKSAKEIILKILVILLKILLTLIIITIPVCATPVALIIIAFTLKASIIVGFIAAFLFIFSLIPFIWIKKRKKYLKGWLCGIAAAVVAVMIPIGLEYYDEYITINTAPSINCNEYLPFTEDSKIVKFDSKTFKLTEKLPIIDGAAACFPVYSAFVNAVYPDTTVLNQGAFVYNNTVEGYKKLANKQTDIFIGAAPSAAQKAYAESLGTEFKYTQIGTEAFVFFVHKNNPIDSLTVEQIKGIYSGEITNWKEVGGRNEKIVAYQRNEGSGSQSMLVRFMDGTPLMKPTTKDVVDGMGGIIKRVADYKSESCSIGFSFRFYVEGIIKNPDIKMIAIDGVAPSVENIKNGSYPVVTPLYAVSYENNQNPNVDALLNWMLSDEGQYIIEETGYVGIQK
ncbi:MAG: substrate-binding domain-containing protein [Clostridia bacterium]|nr:substrate-binding domain-containing protein [Clostridia bacterium]